MTEAALPRALQPIAHLHDIVDEKGEPTFLGDGAGCTEIARAPWPHPLEEPMLLSTFQRYIAQ